MTSTRVPPGDWPLVTRAVSPRAPRCPPPFRDKLAQELASPLPAPVHQKFIVRSHLPSVLPTEYTSIQLLHFPLPRRNTMPNSDLLPSLLHKINENQLALEAAIMEQTLWVEQRGSAQVAGNVRAALQTIDRNEEFIKMTLAVLMTPE